CGASRSRPRWPSTRRRATIPTRCGCCWCSDCGWSRTRRSRLAEPAARQPALAGKRILFLLNNLHLGGAERQALLTARRLRDAHLARVEVWGFNEPGPAASLCEQHGIPWRVVPFRWYDSRLRQAASLVSLAARLRRARPDVLMPYLLVPNV